MKKLFLLLLAVLSVSLCVSAQTRTLRGTVVDATNDDPVIGASVQPAGSTQGVTTDIDGKFVLVCPASVKEITVSYVGMQTKTVAATAGEMFIALSPSTEVLEQLVVTGYGTAKKIGSVVGSVAVVGEATFENVPTPTFVDALQGQVAGLNIYSNSGDPSSVNSNIKIRGTNSLNASNTPLFILDGAPVSPNVFTTLNPQDIASVPYSRTPLRLPSTVRALPTVLSLSLPKKDVSASRLSSLSAPTTVGRRWQATTWT
ncbi:MAG: TonB-dependent receptor [Muribaculaceae bacterium]|nr:TonB-dependent receptor [Muribaculaceae bacterium]